MSQASEVLFGTVQTPHSPNEGVLKLGATWFAVINSTTCHSTNSSFRVKLSQLTPYGSGLVAETELVCLLQLNSKSFNREPLVGRVPKDAQQLCFNGLSSFKFMQASTSEVETQ